MVSARPSPSDIKGKFLYMPEETLPDAGSDGVQDPTEEVPLICQVSWREVCGSQLGLGLLT